MKPKTKQDYLHLLRNTYQAGIDSHHLISANFDIFVSEGKDVIAFEYTHHDGRTVKGSAVPNPYYKPKGDPQDEEQFKQHLRGFVSTVLRQIPAPESMKQVTPPKEGSVTWEERKRSGEN